MYRPKVTEALIPFDVDKEANDASYISF